VAHHDDGPNDLLANARRRLPSPSAPGRAMSRQELAEAVNAYLWHTHHVTDNLDGTYVGHLEKGRHRWPGALRREGLRHVLGAATNADVGFYSTRGEPAPAEPPADPPATSQHLVHPAAEMPGTERSDLLIRAVLLDAGSGDAAAPSLVAAAADHARRIVDDLLDDGTPRAERIERIERAAQDHAVDALTVQPHEMLRRLMLDFLEAQHLIRTCRDVARLRRLWAALAKLAILTVDEMSVIGKVAAGRAWLATAVAAAAKADLRPLEADVRALGAMLWLYHGAADQAAQLAQQSISLADTTVSLATGLAPMLNALAHAKLNNGAATTTALHAAQRAYDLTNDAERVDSVFGFSPRRRLFYEGRLLTMIGDYHAAEQAHRQALDLYPTHVVGDRTIIALDRATALINSNEPDAGTQLIQDTLSALAPGHRSYLFVATAEQALATAPPRTHQHRAMHDCRDMLAEMKQVADQTAVA
jgi:tetratricopeptide (TPR) repeat protein